MNYEYYDAVRELVGIENIVGGNIFGPLNKIEFVNGFTDIPSEQEVQTKLTELRAAEPMRLLRQERNRKLAETDWRATVDYPGTDKNAWLAYRQSLRDLPSTSSPQLDENGQLTNVTWPTKPE